MSVPLSGAVSARNASYNSTTRKLTADTEAPSARPACGWRREKVTFTQEELAYVKAHTPRQ
jgi:hypothetical protein